MSNEKSNFEFMECPTCAAKSGSPVLCKSCLHNRRVITELINQKRALADALKKFAPDLMNELVRRYEAANDSLDSLLRMLWG